jgi:sugar lactone lactonase YvrE
MDRWQPEVVVHTSADVGEGPVWDDRTGELLWVDMTPGFLYRFDPFGGERGVLQVGGFLGSVALRRSGGVVLAMRDGLYSLSHGAAILCQVEEPGPPRFLNDSICDSRGRLFVASVTDDELPDSGCVYRVDPDLSIRKVVRGMTLANGMGFSPDERSMYVVDSRRYEVALYDYDSEAGRLSNGRVFVRTPEPLGLPDGLTVDRDGGVWVAYWGGGCIRRYTPDGAMDRSIAFPVSQVSSCGFGGANFEELYVTSARNGLDEARLVTEAFAGSLFRVRVEVPGTPAQKFGG